MKKGKTLQSETQTTPIIMKVTHVEVTPEGRTERELTGEELEEWKKAHGIDTNKENQSDTE
jgi:hypothetical protein